jgi:hypothetical protein
VAVSDRVAPLFLLVACTALLSTACERPRFVVGESCSINSDCADPLVCVIGSCRRQCVDSRDCGAGLRCLRAESSPQGGACQVDDERACVLTSDCPMRGAQPLVCQNGTCTTPCVEDRDCLEGQTCDEDDDGVVGCFESMEAESCVYNTDCDAPMVCGRDQICHLECLETRDCTRPRVCIANLCELPDGGG